VRWYVEGPTEFFAINQILSDCARLGIELFNLWGDIASGRGNAAFKLDQALKEDRALRRFSIISFDRDVPANVRAIRRQVERGNVVGIIASHDPDFEYANFTLEELVEVAAQLDEQHGYPGDPVRRADWARIASGGAFEREYGAVSARKPSSLKGEEWGRALAKFAIERPRRSDTGVERPLWLQIRAAVRARTSNYDFQSEHFTFDSATFELVRRKP
jgi:hypothetical protein